MVNQGEGELLEFKRKANYPEKIVREMVAFANSKGGHLLIGVDDNGTIAGLKFAEEDQFVIEKAIEKHIKPKIRYRYEYIPVTEKRSVIHYHIYESRRKPAYYISEPGKRGKAILRIEDKSVQASREMVEILKRINRKRSIPIHFGEKEKLLMQHIDTNGKITLEEFRAISGLSKSRASGILVQLVVSNILQVIVNEKDDFYTVKSL